MTVKELQQALKKLKVSFPDKARKADLEKLYAKAQAKATAVKKDWPPKIEAPPVKPPTGTNSKPMKRSRYTGQWENDYS